MTPEEKAKDLLAKMNVIYYRKLVTQPQFEGIPISMHDEQIKQCALVCCDEMIYENNLHLSLFGRDRIKWLVKVKEEINKL